MGECEIEVHRMGCNRVTEGGCEGEVEGGRGGGGGGRGRGGGRRRRRRREKWMSDDEREIGRERL